MLKTVDEVVSRPYKMGQSKPEAGSRLAAHLAALDEGKVRGDVGVLGGQAELRLLLLAVWLGPCLHQVRFHALHGRLKACGLQIEAGTSLEDL